MHDRYPVKKSLFYLIALNIILLLLVVADVFQIGTAKTAHAATYSIDQRSATCPAVGAITSQSLLVVLLDRSGSLTYEPGATDPDGYSTSITKALADLWPGSMAVIPFSKDTTAVIGPYVLADQGQRDQLKNAVQNYPIGGDTPLAPALHKAFDLLKGAAAGSRAVIVTDGSPDPVVMNGVNQIDDVEQNLIPQFCNAGVSVSAFGLTLDLTQSGGQTANRLLSAIATGTGGVYKNVRNSHDLAQVVIKLYADWQHLIFVQATASGDNYTVQLDSYAKKVAFVTFRDNNNSNVSLNGPGGLAVPGQVLQKSTDRHYEIDSMTVTGVNQPGPYTVTAGGDTSAQVYALVESHLHAQLLKPTSQTIAYIGQPLQIEAELLNDSTPVLPQPNEATLVAHVTVQSNGQTVFTNDVELVQQNNAAIFARQVTLPGPATGTVTVAIKAVYLQIPVEASAAHVTIPLEKVVVKKPSCCLPPPPPPCGITCQVKRYSSVLAIGLLVLLLLLLLLFLLLRKGPYGILKQRNEEPLGQIRRSILSKLFHKSILSSRELENSSELQFCGARFDLIFGGGVRIKNKNKSDTPRIRIKKGTQFEEVARGEVGYLDNGDAIQVDNCAPATFIDDTVSSESY
ncbi:MAG: vWA domain-containing protein [Ktedonobacteraceae bacterium]